MSARPLLLGAAAAFGGAGFVIAGTSPAMAHGVGERADLPLPLGLFTWGAAIALIVSFIALRVLWPKPRLDGASEGRRLPDAVQVAGRWVAPVVRLVGLALFVVVLTAAWFGLDTVAANISPVAVYVAFWVGLAVASAVLGDLWRLLSPYDTIVGWVDRARARRGSGPDREASAGDDDEPGFGSWTAAAGIFSFVWLELAYHDPASPRAIAVWMTLYSAAVLWGAARWGRRWLRYGEGFAALFGLLGRLSPFWATADPGDGPTTDPPELRVRAPLSGLSDVVLRPGLPALILVTLGSTGFDGLTRTQWWADVVDNRQGWDATVMNTLGLVWTILLVAAIWYLANRVVGRIGERDGRDMAVLFAPSLVPIVLAYSVAHYFSLLVFEGQNFVALASDPYGEGWDLFGTAANSVDYTAVSTDTIAWVQAGSIVLGHILGVVAAHDRAVSIWSPARAERTQYPLLAVMILYTVGGLALLLGS